MERLYTLIYGNYKIEEMRRVEEIVIRSGAAYSLRHELTVRRHDRYILEARVTKEQEIMIRGEVNKLRNRNPNWGRIGYVPTVEKPKYRY